MANLYREQVLVFTTSSRQTANSRTRTLLPWDLCNQRNGIWQFSHELKNKQISAVMRSLLTSSASFSPVQTEVKTAILMARKEALSLIICFESKVSHVANSIPRGTPCWKYRLRLSCLVQQLKALDEIISPCRLWHSLLLKRARHEKRRMEGEKMKGEKAEIFCQTNVSIQGCGTLCI